VRDGRQPATDSARQLAWLADAVVARVLVLAEREVGQAHGRIPGARFAVLGYGSLGGEELGFGSDLDLVFLYDTGRDTGRDILDSHQSDGGGRAGVEAQSDGARPLDASRWFARLAQKVVALLGAVTAAGRLYDVDVRLRPDGAKGLLVSSLASFADYQRERVSTFLDPARDALGSGFNTLQAEIGVGSGGWFGKGLTEGTQTQLDYLRTQTTDYVFSVLGEELGFIGAMILFALFIILLMRGLRAASISQDVFGQLVAVGVVIFILFQALINIGVNIRLFPVTGIPLPFISQGGSSLITVFIAIGLLESVIMRHKQVSL